MIKLIQIHLMIFCSIGNVLPVTVSQKKCSKGQQRAQTKIEWGEGVSKNIAA